MLQAEAISFVVYTNFVFSEINFTEVKFGNNPSPYII